MATIQEPIVDTIIEPKLDLIDKIKGETLQEIAIFLHNRDIKFGHLPAYLVDPQAYPGNKSIGLKLISEKFLQDIVSKYYFKIQAEGLPVKFIINTIMKNLFEGGRDSKRYANITVATRGEDDARKDVIPSRIDESPRLLIVKNKNRKVRSTSHSNLPTKKIKKKVRTSKKGRKGSCAYCGASVKTKVTANTTHINITQNPTHHRFCSKECKTEWIHDLLN